ncbi:MAG TPA: hypothetical protein PK640_05530 [Verrucomicrobiota bacterium]|nr:hypothetical protein [Verrucomicrobiota bacterium]
MAAITQSAEQAAGDFLAGGNLWAAGRQGDFVAEACGRAGGLMSVAPLGEPSPTNRDVILFAVPGRLVESDSDKITQWEKKGVRVVGFHSPAGVFADRFPLDTVANVSDLWIWTGEFVAACTRRGKMPVLYQSYGLPGGPERGKKYQGKRFHDDLVIQPIGPGVLGREYLSQISRMLAGIQSTQMPRIVQAAQWWRQASSNSSTILVTGHMFPRHAEDPRSIPCGRFEQAPAWEDKVLVDAAHPPEFVLYLGYQYGPRKLVDWAGASGVKLVYTTVQPVQPAQPASNIVYLNLGWPLTDACVRVPGYDVPIMPASGVLQAAIYWALASERARAVP